MLNYTAPLSAVDAHIDSHKAWVARHIDSGVFLLAGRRVPRTGGFILAAGIDRAQLDAIIAADSFVIGGVAVYDVYEVAPTMASGALASLLPDH